MARLILVSNRLPVTVKADRAGTSVALSHGGLATGLRVPHERSGGVWVGWPGDVGKLSSAQREQVDSELLAKRLVPVHLSHSEMNRYYEGYSNRVLRPLFHYLQDRIP